MLSFVAMTAAAGLLASTAGGTPVAATGGPAAAPAAVAPPTPNPDDKVVCRTYDTTGSRLDSYKVCHTMAEWRQVNRAARDEINDVQRRDLQVTHTGSVGAGG